MIIHDLDPYHLMMQWLTVSAVYRRVVYTLPCLIQVEMHRYYLAMLIELLLHPPSVLLWDRCSPYH